MIERAIAILQKAEYDLTARELADIFWLAVHMESLSEQSPQPITEPSPPLPTPKPDTPNKPLAPPRSENKLPVTPDRPTAPVVPSPPETQKPSDKENTEAIPIKIPAAAALRNSLALGRALRPLMRKVPSSTEKILDEEATAQRFAEDEIGIPILQSTPEKWLELALVIEETSITEIWQQTIKEFQLLLKHHGAFRDVRTWKLKGVETSTATKETKQTKIQLFPQNSMGFDELAPHKPDVLIDPKGRRLILLVSDCISAIWRKQLIHPVLELWGQRGLITIIQLLPERFWDRTALVDEIPVLLSNIAPGAYNYQLTYNLWDEDDIDEFAAENKRKNLNSSISIPIVTLEPEPLRIWSQVIVGQGNISTAGFKFYSFYSRKETKKSADSPPLTPQLSAAELVDLFRVNASLQARLLAGLMATLPVSISVVHLVQQTLLPESTQIHVAEVFMSGMLKRLPVSQQDDTEYITYEFIDGVRELLRDFVPPHKQISVIDRVTESIVERLGLSVKEFDAQLLTYHGNDALEAKIRPFAKFKAQVLRQLGGKYALEAEKLEFMQQYAGEYTCAVKWGGKAGIWQKESEPEHLFISPQGEVKFRSRFGLAVIKNLKFEAQTLSWNSDSNQTAAGINFKLNSENSYFWEDSHKGKLFEGWLQYPKEGRIDFRGRFVSSELQTLKFRIPTISVEEDINPQPFEFDVATIELKKTELIINRHRQQNQYFVENLGSGIELEMVLIPDGTFTMGAPKTEQGSRESERLQHEVRVRSFFMGRYPITQAQWRAIASRENLKVERDLSLDPSYFKNRKESDRCPVESVSWYDAVEFCARLSKHTGREYRLPSEAEWEYACRGGTTTAFHFGETITSELANYDATETYGVGSKGIYRKTTTPVGSFNAANAFGLSDMHGNVWEWCLDDWHSNYENAPTDGSAWFDNNNDNLFQKSGTAVLRGGSWVNDPDSCRSASRLSYVTRAYLYSSIGFRVVCAVGRSFQ